MLIRIAEPSFLIPELDSGCGLSGLDSASAAVELVFVFGIVAAPILCRMLSALWPAYAPEQDHPWANALLLGLSVVMIYAAFPSRADLAVQVERQSPVGAVEYIHSHHLTGAMLNEYVFGGYMIWAAPDHPVSSFR